MISNQAEDAFPAGIVKTQAGENHFGEGGTRFSVSEEVSNAIRANRKAGRLSNIMQ